ncbi:RNA-binding E3 ubiquitin-protein ligase MEX3C-like [Onychostruthus taczanowskii]|uniref:RNA-binding E3 ubiquitin-protein ligase MEX3C-like n=1 Tax=Onychostruthus taczanowskii TaxID=356909 RepID=UPI001B809C1B|nr:RNA-binding E3 ubiquitin-protein ligase MEX3C-like [Onychostruthus taczanowskii]
MCRQSVRAVRPAGSAAPLRGVGRAGVEPEPAAALGLKLRLGLGLGQAAWCCADARVSRTGCKIKALRAKTNTYIKTPARGEEPVFVVTGRTEDVAAAKREILSAAEHFSLIRAWRGGTAGPGGPCRPPAPPGHTTVRVRVPYRVVGLVVGPKGSTVKSIQRRTRTYIVTPGRGEEPAFQVTGAPEDVERARQEIEMHVAVRAGAFLELGHDGGADGTDDVWPGARARSRMFSSYRNDSSGSLGSGSTDSYFSPASPFGTGGFWIGEAPPAAGAEELAMDSPADEPLPARSPTAWAPFEPAAALSGSRPPTPRLSPTFSESLEHPLARWARSEPPGSGRRPELPVYIPAFSNGTSSYSSSNGGSASSSPPECRRRHDCVVCFDGEAAAALVPCGHNLFCLRCAGRICARDAPACPVCRTAVTQAIRSYSCTANTFSVGGGAVGVTGMAKPRAGTGTAPGRARHSPGQGLGTGGFWIGEAPPAAGAEELAMDSPADEPLPARSPTAWAPFEPAAALSGSRPPTPRLSPTFSESLEHPLARWARSEPPGSSRRPELPVYIPAFSNGTSSYSSSNGGSASSSPPECRRRHDCVVCFDGEAAAALVPCGHNLFCLRCAGRICARDAPACPVCRTAVTQAIRSYS